MSAHDAHLPALGEDAAERIEQDVFRRIGADRRSRRRRRRGWAFGAAGAAVVVVAAAAIGPVVVRTGGMATSTTGIVSSAVGEAAPAPAAGMPGAAADAPLQSLSTDGRAASGRDVLSTASATVAVEDVREAADRIGDDAMARGGSVESLTLATETSSRVGDATIEIWPPVGVDMITVRVPAAALADTISALSDVGAVTASSVTAQDVTAGADDLRARVAAQEASVARLTELMGAAGSTADLIAAESALAERQATLTFDREQLARLETDVAHASLTVTLTGPPTPVDADPAGFLDGIAAGWNGLVVAVNGAAIGLGFLLPWLGVAAVVGLIAWGVVGLVRRRTRRGSGADRPDGFA